MDWDFILPMHDPHTADMVSVVVRDKQGLNGADINTAALKALLDRDTGDAGVQQQPHAGRFDEDAIAVTARLERDDPHGSLYPYQEVGRRRGGPERIL